MSTPGPPDVSIVLPAYNGEAFLQRSIELATATVQEWPMQTELIVVDDGSNDGTPALLAACPGVRVVRLEQNSGKGAALRAGMRAASGRVRAFTDADLPYGLDDLPTAVRYVTDRGYHAVIGDRTLPGSSYEAVGWTRAAASELASFAFRTLVTGGIYDTQCGFKVFRGDVADAIFSVARIDGFATDVEIIYLLLKHRLDIKRIPVRLQRNAPSTVHVLRDSARAFRDIARMRWSWARGHYRSSALLRILEEDLRRDRTDFAGTHRKHD